MVSLAIRMPFTLQYAKERIPKEYWSLPLFVAIDDRVWVVGRSRYGKRQSPNQRARRLEPKSCFSARKSIDGS